MTFCPICRADVPDGSTFCPQCGARIEKPREAEPEPRFCRHCGTEVPKGARFCPACGRDITTGDGKNHSGDNGANSRDDGREPKPRTSFREAGRSLSPNLRGKVYALIIGIVALGITAVVIATCNRATAREATPDTGVTGGTSHTSVATDTADDAAADVGAIITTPANNLANMANGGTCVSDGDRFFFYSRATDTIYTTTIATGASGVTEVVALNLKGESEGVNGMALQGDRLLFVYTYRENNATHQRLYSIDVTGNDGGNSSVILTDDDLLAEFASRKAARITTLYASENGTIFVGADITDDTGNNDYYVFTVAADGTIGDHNYLPIDSGRAHVVRIGPNHIVFPDGDVRDFLGSEPTAGDGSYQILYTPNDHKLLVMPMALDDRAYVYEYGGDTDSKQLVEVPFDGGDVTPLIGLDLSSDLISYVPCGDALVVSVLSWGTGGSASVGLARVAADGTIDEYDLEGGSTFRDQLTLFDLGSDHFLAMSSYNEPTNNGDFVVMVGLNGDGFEILVDE